MKCTSTANFANVSHAGRKNQSAGYRIVIARVLRYRKRVLQFTEETVLQHKVSAETFAAVGKYFSHDVLVELAIAAGCYMMVSIFLNTFEVNIEEKDAPL